MKRIIYTITLLSGLACCWSACSKDEEEMIEKRKAVTETEITDETESDGNTGEGTTKAYTYNNPVTIAMGEEYGTLKNKLGNNLETADKLILTGKIDANDVQTFLNEMPALLAIDMAEVTFVETDAKFSQEGYTNLSESLKEGQIGKYMFYRRDFQEIVLPKAIKSIESEAFGWCSNLTSIVLPEELTALPYHVFYGCNKLTSVALYNKLEQIGEGAFCDCKALSSIELPTSLTSIGDGAFEGCSSLTSVSMPESITTINSYTFQNCSNLSSVSIPSVTSIGKAAFYNCSSLVSIDLSHVTSFDESAFQSCGSLTSITLAEGVETISNGAFSDCSSLTSVILPSTLTSINENAFYGCTSLPKIEIPSSVTLLGRTAFNGCKSLKEITLSDEITELPYGVFWDCTLLESVHLPANLKKIGEIAFYQCPALTTIELPATLEDIGKQAFSDSGLSSIDLTQSSLTTLGTSAFSLTNLTTITIPTSITSIPEYCFYNCQKLTSVSLPEGLESIGNYAFQHCEHLTSVNFPSTLTTINYGAFEYCCVLGAISLPQNLQTIGEYAFRGCTKVTFDSHLPESLSSIGSCAFSGLHAMQEFIFPGGVTTLPNYICYNCTNLQSITISEGCTSIGQGAFKKDEPTVKLVTIHLPSTLTTIGNEAFSGCGLTDLDFLNEGLKTIGNHAFDGCNLSGDLTLPSTIEQIDYGVFASNSNSITSIHLQNTSTTVTLGDLFSTQVNCLIYSPSDRVSTTSPTNLPNIICKGRISSLILIESKPFKCPEAFVAGKVTFTKQFNRANWNSEARMSKGKASNWYSLSLPFKVDQITAKAKDGNTYTFAPFGADTDGDTKPFWLRRLTTSGDFTFENKTVIEAGEPYIIAFPNSESYTDEYNVAGDVTFSATGTITIPVTEEREVSSGGFNYMRSNYEILPKSASIYLLNSPHTNGDMGGVLGNYSYWGSYFIRSLRDSWPFEAYVTSSSGAAAFSINPATPTTRSSGPQGPVPSIDDM